MGPSRIEPFRDGSKLFCFLSLFSSSENFSICKVLSAIVFIHHHRGMSMAWRFARTQGGPSVHMSVFVWIFGYYRVKGECPQLYRFSGGTRGSVRNGSVHHWQGLLSTHSSECMSVATLQGHAD